ncbi:MAG: autotransporter outer membrane beta-barrel domain-containing protein [Candidatus Omnitrophica bacterium]|nr:autotransporter outer membrane beta-barrel domain-containing protein [Candidatus Omnitrophota bacterium]
MKKPILLSLVGTICFIFIGMGSVFAEPLKVHTWELGTEISHITYKEPGVMEEKGMMYGIVGSYAYHNKLMLKAEGKGSWGQVDYKNSGTIDSINDYILEFIGLGGYDFSVFTATTLTPYIGIGYRYLNDDSSGKISSTGAHGYERESNYIYSPIGVEVITPLKNDWSVGATAEYDLFWWGKQKSHLSDVLSGLNDLENRQNKGYGIRGSIKVQKKLSKLDLVIEPYVRYWNIKKSKDADITYHGTKIGYGYEPKNNSTEIGCKFAAKF